MTMEWVRRNYRVPAKRGGRVRFCGNEEPIEGTITSASHYLRVRPDGQPRRRLLLHPTWCVEYLDGNERTPAQAQAPRRLTGTVALQPKEQYL